MALVATVLSLVAHPTIDVDADAAIVLHARCRTNACERRVSHRATLAKWRRAVRPYRSWLRATRWCESRGIYTINTGNGFYGAYQFTLQSWRAVGGFGYPHRAPPIEQDYRAVRLLHVQGRGAWPVCG